MELSALSARSGHSGPDQTGKQVVALHQRITGCCALSALLGNSFLCWLGALRVSHSLTSQVILFTAFDFIFLRQYIYNYICVEYISKIINY